MGRRRRLRRRSTTTTTPATTPSTRSIRLASASCVPILSASATSSPATGGESRVVQRWWAQASSGSVPHPFSSGQLPQRASPPLASASEQQTPSLRGQRSGSAFTTSADGRLCAAQPSMRLWRQQEEEEAPRSRASCSADDATSQVEISRGRGACIHRLDVGCWRAGNVDRWGHWERQAIDAPCNRTVCSRRRVHGARCLACRTLCRETVSVPTPVSCPRRSVTDVRYQYNYAGDDPINETDPTGLAICH